MKRALTILAIAFFLYEGYQIWRKLQRKKLLRQITERFGSISGLEKKTEDELTEMLTSGGK